MIKLSSFYKSFSPYIEAVLNFIYPPFCIICDVRLDSGSELICEQCWNCLPRINHSIENKLNISNKNSKIPEVSCVISVWEYSDEVQKIIHEMKYFKKQSLAGLMGDEMAKLVLADRVYSSADLIIPVPLHKTRLRERGFNQSILLSNRIATISKIPVERNVLKRIRYTKPQSKLGAVEREKNVQGAFEVTESNSLIDKQVILVDDVLTTGSTIRACAKVLIQAGVSKILAITAAKAI
ncbi:MAG: ComF family protein [bacterium]